MDSVLFVLVDRVDRMDLGQVLCNHTTVRRDSQGARVSGRKGGEDTGEYLQEGDRLVAHHTVLLESRTIRAVTGLRIDELQKGPQVRLVHWLH